MGLNDSKKGFHLEASDYVTRLVVEVQKYFNGNLVRFLIPDEEEMIEGEIYALYKSENGEWCYNIKSNKGIYNDIPQGDIVERISKPVDRRSSFEKFLELMLETYKKKNHDYGNSFTESCDEHGLVAADVRISDKMRRFKSLYRKPDAAKVEESLIDTLLDLANYAVMTASYIKDKEEEDEDEW